MPRAARRGPAGHSRKPSPPSRTHFDWLVRLSVSSVRPFCRQSSLPAQHAATGTRFVVPGMQRTTSTHQDGTLSLLEPPCLARTIALCPSLPPSLRSLVCVCLSVCQFLRVVSCKSPLWAWWKGHPPHHHSWLLTSRWYGCTYRRHDPHPSIHSSPMCLSYADVGQQIGFLLQQSHKGDRAYRRSPAAIHGA